MKIKIEIEGSPEELDQEMKKLVKRYFDPKVWGKALRVTVDQDLHNDPGLSEEERQRLQRLRNKTKEVAAP
jgi:hypothetical protein